MNLAALKYPGFRTYLVGNVFALNGLMMQRVTVGWLAWDMTGSASFVGFVSFMSFAPTMLTGPLFGVLIDRVRVERAAIITQSIMFALALLLFGSFSLGYLTPTVLAVISGMSGVVSSAHNPIRMSLAPRLVRRSAVASVVTLVAINFNLARLTGPALGGWSIASLGVGPSLFVQSLFYLPFILAISFLHPRDRADTQGDHEAFLGALKSGFSYVMRHEMTLNAILITGTFALVIRGTLEILPVLADGVFDKGAAGLGLLTSSAGVGALVAGLSKALQPGQSRRRLPRPALAAALAGTAIVPLLGASGVWAVSLALVACLGFTASLTAISMQTAIQVDLDDALRGRVMSLWVMVGIGAAAVGAVILGGLSDQFGFAATLGGAGLLGSLLLLRFVIRMW